MAGDLLADMEGEAGGVGSVQFGIDLDLCQSDVQSSTCAGSIGNPTTTSTT